MKRANVLTASDLPEALSAHPTAVDGVVLGRLVDIGPDGTPSVDFPGNPTGGPVRAAATRNYHRLDVGRDVALMFLDGRADRPLLLGLIVAAAAGAMAGAPTGAAAEAGVAAAVTVDGDRTIITAARQIVLRCGAASITLTRAGKVLIRGTYLLSRSSGVNRIKGGSIQLN
ncbi:MAG: hypothetical protein IPK64_14895 [bacterium]|nr:hypothetical protein [bacterium]